MTNYISPADLPDGEHLALVRWGDGTEALRFVNRNAYRRTTSASHVTKWELSSGRIVTLLHRADECPGTGWEPAEFGPELAGQAVRVETLHGAVEGPARWGGTGIIGVHSPTASRMRPPGHLGEVGYLWIDQETVVRVFTRPDPHADLIEQLCDLLGSLPEVEIERVIDAAKAAKPGGAS